MLLRIGRELRQHPAPRLVVLSVLVGVVAGVGALLFNLMLDSSSHLLLQRVVGYSPPQPGGEGDSVLPAAPTRRWLLLLIPALGGLASGLLVYTIAPEAEGHGTDAMIDAFHRRKGIIRKRIPLLKTVASALTIGAGGSAGREGPIAQVGAGFGSALATWLRTTERERRMLMLAGAGAGIGAVFRAPLGGALFATEVLYREMAFESGALVPSFIAAITSYSIYCAASGKWGAIFSVPRMQFHHPLELPLYVVLGLVCALAGTLYVATFYGMRDRVFRRISIPPHLKPALGGLAVGAIGLLLPQILSMGYGWVQLAMDGQLPLKLMVAIVFVKMLATSLTIGSGGSGGVFAPSMVIGGMLGASVGTVLHLWLPTVVLQPAAFALVGMAGFFAGVAKTPVSSLIMVSEMTGGYGLLAPLMLTTAIGYLATPKRRSLYEHQVDSRVASPANEGEFVMDVLEGIRVRDALPAERRFVSVRRNTPLPELLRAVADSRQSLFPVLEQDGTLVGAIYFDDIRGLLAERDPSPRGVVAQDLLAVDTPVILMDDHVSAALQRFRTTLREELAVVDDEVARRVVAVLSRHDVLVTYQDRVSRQRRA